VGAEFTRCVETGWFSHVGLYQQRKTTDGKKERWEVMVVVVVMNSGNFDNVWSWGRNGWSVCADAKSFFRFSLYTHQQNGKDLGNCSFSKKCQELTATFISKHHQTLFKNKRNKLL